MGRGGSVPPEFLSRDERTSIFGIETVERLVWRKWDVGGEYVRHLVLKNVTKVTQKIKYKLPPTMYFTMDYPEPCKLSAGMSLSIQVTFRPVKLERYDDYIELSSNMGTFYVPVRAVLPYADMQAPEQLDFGYCPAKETTSKSFSFTNTGKLEVNYFWRLDSPFELTPPTGRIMPGETHSVACTFSPVEGSVFVATAVCEMQGEGEMAAVKISGIGKYPYLHVEESHLDFGEVVVGKVVEKTFKLSNQSLVPATFKATRGDLDPDRVFTIRPNEGTIPPNGYEAVTISYQPLCTGTTTCDSFAVSTPAGITKTIGVKGVAKGPDVNLSSTSINFQSVEMGSSTTRIIYLENAADTSIGYQILTDECGVFNCDRTQGTCGPKASIPISISFKPREVSVYHKRVVILVKARTTPLVFDIVGTAFLEQKRPPLLKQSHVDSFYYKAKEDISGEGSVVPAPGTSFITSLNANEQWAEVFYPNHLKPVSVDTSYLDFGRCSRQQLAEYKQVTVTNMSNHKLSVFWHAPLDARGVASGEDPRPVFTVFPDGADLKPHGSHTFRVGFRPGRDGHSYFNHLECFAYLKAMRNFRLVTEDTISPPWCLTVAAGGATSSSSLEQFMPKVEFTSKRVTFPPCEVGRAAFSTVCLTNAGDTAIRFNFPEHYRPLELPSSKPQAPIQGPVSGQFSLFPVAGLIPPGGFQLLALQFCPTAAGSFSESVVCSINGLESGRSLELGMTGTGDVARLACKASVYFKPTCVGAASARQLALTNASKIPVHFLFSISNKVKDVISVRPLRGTLAGGESIPVEWSFVPHHEKHYLTKVKCVYASAVSGITNFLTAACLDQPEEFERLTVTAIGDGTAGAVALEPSRLDFGTNLPGGVVEKTVDIVNLSNGNLHYQLVVKAVSAVGEGVEEGADLSGCIVLDKPAGVLANRSRQTVRVTFSAGGRANFVFQLECRTANKPANMLSADESACAEGVAHPSVEVVAISDYPILSVTDVGCDRFGKRTLWAQMSTSEINSALAATLTPAEEKLRAAAGKAKVKNVTQILHMLTPITVDFAAGVAGAPPTILHVELCNSGQLPIDWRIILRTDQEIDLENWIDLGLPTSKEDEEQLNIVENKVMDVWPRKGQLAPGDKGLLTLTYTHEQLGDHKLPLLLEVEGGKRLHVVLHGLTLKEDASLLRFHSKEHYFKPVAIGQSEPSVQMYELRNIGPQTLDYIVDMSPIEHLKTTNYGFKVLECMNPQGVVPPFGVAYIKWRFQPMEMRLYQVDVPITTVGAGTTEIIKFVGRGYHPTAEGAFKHLPEECQSMPSTWPGYSHLTSPELEAASARSFVLTCVGLPLGTLPALSLTRRLVTLTSHATKPFEFEWDLSAAATLEGKIKVEPWSGVIQGGAQMLFKVEYAAGAWPEAFDLEVRCMLFPIAAEDAPPIPQTDAEVFANDGVDFRTTKTLGTLQSGAQAGGRKLAAERHTVSTMGKFNHAGESLEPRAPVGFHTQFNMAAHLLEERYQTAEDVTQVVLNIEATVLLESAYTETYGPDMYRFHYIPLRTAPPKREPSAAEGGLPPHLPAQDVASILSELLLDVVHDPLFRTESFSLKTLPAAKHLFVEQMPGLKRTPPFDENDPESVIEPEWFERLAVCRPRGIEDILASFTPPRPPPPVPPEEEEEEEHEEEGDKHKKKGEKGKKADPAAEEAERLAKLEAKARRKAEAEARLAEEMAEYELAVAAAQQAKIDEQNKRKEDAKETTRLLAEAKAARVAEMEAESETLAGRKVFCDSAECVQLAEMIIEGTLFNLMRENQYTHEFI